MRPKVTKSVHYCEATKAFTTREYRDVTALTGLPTGAQYPQRDDAGNLLTTEFGMCRYIDNQVRGAAQHSSAGRSTRRGSTGLGRC